VANNFNRQDSVLKRGTVIYTINGRTARQLTDTLFPYIVTDGYNLTGKYQYLSSGFISAPGIRIFSDMIRDSISYRDTAGHTGKPYPGV
jgi:hypothetical protein